MNIPERYVTAPGPYPPARLKPARGADRPISKSNPPKRPDYYVHIIPYSLRISECRPGFTAHPARRGANSAVERPTLQQHRRNNNCSAPTGRRALRGQVQVGALQEVQRWQGLGSARRPAQVHGATSRSVSNGHTKDERVLPKSAERVRILGCKKRGRPSDKPMATGEGWVAPRSKGHSVSRHAGCRCPVNQASLTRFALPSYATIATPSSRSRSPYTSPLYESFYSAFALRFDLQGLHSLCKCLTDDYICQRLHGGSFWFYTPRGRG